MTQKNPPQVIEELIKAYEEFEGKLHQIKSEHQESISEALKNAEKRQIKKLLDKLNS